jgi:protein-disulfide isomerase
MLAQRALIEGNPASEVRVVIYEDLQCPDCADFRAMLDTKLLPKYGGRVAFEHRDFPLPKHAWAKRGSVAARFIQERSAEQALEYRRTLLRELRSIKPETFEAHLRAWCGKNGLDGEAAVAALSDARLVKLVEDDYEDGVARGIAKTPTVVVNGRPFIERFPYEDLAAAIESALKAAEKKR